MEPNNTPMEGMPQSSNGPVVGIVIIVLVLLVGGFFFAGRFWGAQQPAADTASTTDAGFAPTATSDDPAAIGNDLNAENFNNIDAGLNDIDTQANQ